MKKKRETDGWNGRVEQLARATRPKVGRRGGVGAVLRCGVCCFPLPSAALRQTRRDAVCDDSVGHDHFRLAYPLSLLPPTSHGSHD